MRRTLLFLLCCFYAFSLFGQDHSLSGKQKAVKTSGDVIFVAAPLTCLATTIFLGDMQGLKQGAFAGATSLGVTYLLKFAVGKERPDGGNNLSFPSAHTAVTFTGAAFLQRRYGWQWGVPAYLLAGYVGWSRTYANKHDWWDVVAGAVIGAGSAYIFTRPFAKKHHLSIAPVATGRDFGFHASLMF